MVTPGKVIVSGHQRVRACKELGLETIKAVVKDYESEDDVLKDLIETNICRRGIGNLNKVKLGRCIIELERIYGIQHGGKRKSGARPNNSVLRTQRELADKLDISVDTLQNYKKLTQMIPELEELVDTGVVTVTAALAVVKELIPEEQRELVSMIDPRERLNKTIAENMIEEIKDQEKGEGRKMEQGNMLEFPEPLEQKMEHYFKEFTENVLELLGRQMPQTMRRRCIEVAEKQNKELIEVIRKAKIAFGA